MGDAVAIGDLSCITSCESWSWGGWNPVCVGKRGSERESGEGGEEEMRKRKEEGVKEGGREYQMTSTSSI